MTDATTPADTTADLIDDITGDIDDNEIDRAIATITANLAKIDTDGRANILDAAQVAGGDNEKNIRAALDTAPAKPKTTRRAPVKKTPAKKTPAEFAPTVDDKGRLNHAGCGHPRDMKGRSACRAWFAKQPKK